MIKKTSFLISMIIVVAAIVGLIYVWKDLGSSKGAKIQTTSMVLLVLVTIYYAFQTKYLVESQKKEKQIDFIYGRVKDFLYPLLWTLSEIDVSIKKLDENDTKIIDEKVQVVLKEIREFGFLIEEGISGLILEWHDKIFEYTINLSDKLKKAEAIKINDSLTSIINKNYRIYQNKLKNFYKIPID